MRFSAICAFALYYSVPIHAGAFQPGEKLVYEAHWGIIKAARIQMEVLRAPQHPKSPPAQLLFRGQCRSFGVVDKIYPIRSQVETLARAPDFRPIRFTENRSEGRHRYERTMSYDFDSKQGIWSNKISGRDKRIKLPRVAHDQLTAFYALRKKGLIAGTSQTLEVLADGKYEKITYSVDHPAERSIGKWAAMPVVEITSEDIMEKATRRKASMRMFVTADSRAIPLQIDLRASWGTVSLHLVEASGLVGGPLVEAQSTGVTRTTRGRRG